MNWFYFSSPSTFYRLAGWFAPWFFGLAAVLAAAGLYVAFVEAPTDAQQGEVYRIIFIHVPAAWMSMFLYFVMACYGAMSLTFNTRLAAMMARAIAPTGAMFTFVALWTGAFWGRPTWGTYWVWDARLTFGAGAALPLLRLHRARQRLRGPAPRRPRGGPARAHRPREPADHLFLGELVEHPAPGLERELQGNDDARDDVYGDDADDVRLLDVRDRSRSRTGARRYPRARAAHALGARTVSHEFYLWMSYGVTALAVIVEIAALRRARARALRYVEEERHLETQD